jgi:hypothetical protein
MYVPGMRHQRVGFSNTATQERRWNKATPKNETAWNWNQFLLLGSETSLSEVLDRVLRKL